MGLSPLPESNAIFRQTVSDRIELNRSPGWCHGGLFGVGKNLTHLVTRHDMFCMRSKEDTGKKQRVGKKRFSLLRKIELNFSKRGSIKEGMIKTVAEINKIERQHII